MRLGRLRVFAVTLAGGAALLAGAAASAQAVPSTTGEMTRAPRVVARGGATVETAPAARTKARAGRRTGARRPVPAPRAGGASVALR